MRYCVAILLIVSVLPISAINRWDFFCSDGIDRLAVGLRLGAGYGSVSNVKSMFEKSEKKPDYTWKGKAFVRPTADVFAEYKFLRVSASVEGLYYMHGFDLEKHASRENSEYAIGWQFLSVGLCFKVYCTERFYMGLCGRYGFNISTDYRFSSDKFVSHDDYEGRGRKQLEASLSTADDFSVGIVIGYAFKNALMIEGRCLYGLKDFIKTHANDYGYTEQPNNTLWASLTVGYPIIVFER